MKESEIRPEELFNKYLDLSTQDGQLLDRNEFVEISCPSCGEDKSPVSFVKNDYSYKVCQACNNLFCSPRPNEEQLKYLYSESKSSAYWSKEFFPAVCEARKEKLFKPKAKKIKELLSLRNIKINTLCDIGAGHGLFLEEISKTLEEVNLFAIEPDLNSAKICEGKGIEVLNKTVENSSEWSDKFDFVISSEVIEHVYDPQVFIAGLHSLLKEDGYLLITGLGYEGFDILTLQADSKAVTPPHHLNFFSIKGFEQIFSKAGFSKFDIWTPGKLDVDIVLNSNTLNPFFNALKDRGDDALKEFQDFLVKYKLSSHVWILAQK